MKMKSLLIVSAMMVLCCTIFGCGKDKNTTIYGTVFDSETHEPIVGAQIEVEYRSGSYVTGQFSSSDDYKISSSVSGADGLFELQFGDVQVPNGWRWYYIYGTAKGYKDSYQPAGIVIGSSYRMDINLVPK